MTDRANSSKGIRSFLSAHGIQCSLPAKEAYKRRNDVGLRFNTLKQWRSLATRGRLASPNLPISGLTIWIATLGDKH